MAVETAAFDYPDEVTSLVSQRTLDLLERRARTPSYRRRGWIVRRALLVADIAGLVIAFAASESVYRLGNGGSLGGLGEPLLFLAALPVWVLAAKLYGLYERDEERTDHSTTDDFGGVFHMVTIGSWAVGALVGFANIGHPPWGKLILFWALAVVGVCACRVTARSVCRRHVLYLQNTVILGTGDVAHAVARKVLHHHEYGLNIVGFVDTVDNLQADATLDDVAYLGEPQRLNALVALLDVERVIVAFPQMSNDDTTELIRKLSEAGVQVDLVPRLHDLITRGLTIHTIEGLPLIGLPSPTLSRSSRLVKRTFDVLFATVALVLLTPVLAVAALAIRLTSRGPVLFCQERMGAGDRPFRIFKFRTMVDGADAQKAALAHLNHYNGGNDGGPMFKIHGDPRVTRVGRILRRHFVDELPQLLNVLRGEMTIVGPRPLVLDEDSYVDDWGRTRLALKPGMTGMWQVLGRNDIGFDEMIRLDYQYVSTWSLAEDIRLVFRTLPLVFTGGASV